MTATTETTPVLPQAIAATGPTSMEQQNATDVMKVVEHEDKPLAATRLKGSQCFVDTMKKETTPAACHPYLACFADCKQPNVETLIDQKISKYEWNEARLHAKYPGVLKPVLESPKCVQRIPLALEKVCHLS